MPHHNLRKQDFIAFLIKTRDSLRGTLSWSLQEWLKDYEGWNFEAVWET